LGRRSGVAASADHLKALVRSHVDGDDERFYSVALQVAARAARSGQHRYAEELKRLVDEAAGQRIAPRMGTVPIARPKGELGDLLSVAYPQHSLADVVLPVDIHGQLARVVHEQRQRARLEKHGFVPAHRIMLEGPPGTGKNMTASALAHDLKVPLFTIRLDSLLSKFLGETSAKLRLVFDAVSEQRAVYFFDEFDALGGDRAGNDVGEARRILNSFLGFLEASPSSSVVVAATNHRTLLDRALFRRFDLVVTFPLPSRDAAIEVLQRRLRGIQGRVAWSKLETELEGLSPADLVRAAEAAAKDAILNDAKTVGTERLLMALRDRRASQGG
jgi:SpoVK/Ycf46/Vps4 family AAA+-type ATPase